MTDPSPDQLNQTWTDCRTGALAYIRSLQSDQPYRLRVSHAAAEPIALASATALLTIGFLDALDQIDAPTRTAWIDYLQSFQTPTGLFEDPVDTTESTQGYPRWALLAHRSRHIAWALETLGVRLARPINFVEPLTRPGLIEDWFRELWNQLEPGQIWAAGNWIMDMGVLLDLQYRHFGDQAARTALLALLDQLDQVQDPETGFWKLPPDPLLNAMAGSMHLYPLYLAYGRPIPRFDQVVQNTLALQQSDGMFGPEPGTGGASCLEYDALAILANGAVLLPETRPAVRAACSRLLPPLLANRNSDGSFADSLVDEIRYWGTKAAAYHAQAGSVWDLYARLMTLALAIEILTDAPPPIPPQRTPPLRTLPRRPRMAQRNLPRQPPLARILHESA